MEAQEKAERALQYLAHTDLEIADWRVAVLRSEYMAEVAEAMAYKLMEGTVEDRKRGAKCAPEVQTKKEEHFQAVKQFELLKARRKRAELTFEMWRSLNANRRIGNIT